MSTINNPHVVTDLFNAFAEAQKAMTELPQVRAEHKALTESYESLEHLYDKALEDLTDADREIERLRSELSAKEAALFAATFREKELRSKHKALRTLLADGLDFSREAMPAPVVGQSDVNPTTPTDTVDSTPGQSPTAPESSVTSEGDVSKGQSEEGPTVVVNRLSSTSTECQNVGSEVADQPESVCSLNIQSYGDGPTPSGTGHSKPPTMFWGEWLATGGEPPPWMTADAVKAHIDAHNSAVLQSINQ